MILSIIILSVFSLFNLIVVGYLINKVYKMREILIEKDMEIMNLNMRLQLTYPKIGFLKATISMKDATSAFQLFAHTLGNIGGLRLGK